MMVDIIVPRGIENRVAIEMVVEHVQRTLKEKSRKHQDDLQRLGQLAEDEPLSDNVLLMKQTNQIVGMSTIIQNPMTKEVDFIFYFDRLSSLLVERYEQIPADKAVCSQLSPEPWRISTFSHNKYPPLKATDTKA